MPNALQSALLFLINTLFDLVLFVLIIRIILVWVRSDYFNPLSQMVIKLTQFLIKPMRRYIPNFRHLETATVLVALIIAILKFFLLGCLLLGMPFIGGVIILALADLIKITLLTFTYAILLQVLLTWIQPGSPLNRVMNLFTSPIMYPLHRVIPPIGGIDITPIPAILILQLLVILLVNPMTSVGTGMM